MAEDGDGEDVTAVSVAWLAETLGVTARRVRQLRENGELVARGRGLIDAPHALNAHLGRKALGAVGATVGKFEAAAVGWLIGHRACGVGPDDLAIWITVAARRGLTEAEASATLMSASALLGERAPAFGARAAESRRTR